MGTNYYLVKQEGEICSHCKRGATSTKLHIGKSSGGWCFALHVLPDDGVRDLQDWIPLFRQGKIEDEYGEALSAEEMLSVITSREWPYDPNKIPFGYSSREDFNQQNYAKSGPNGLSRHKLISEGGHNCVSNGEGTWDCCTGDFS